MRKNGFVRVGAGLATAASVAMTCPSIASTLYVDDSASPQGDGLSWQTAFDDLQLALDLASAPGSTITEIRIGQGRLRNRLRQQISWT